MDEENDDLFETILEEMEDERRLSRRRQPDRDDRPADGRQIHPRLLLLHGQSASVLQTYIEMLSTADTVARCIARMRLLGDWLHDEADRLEGKGAVNFHKSFGLH